MELLLKNNEDVLVKSEKHKLKITSDCTGKLSYDFDGEIVKIEDVLVAEQIDTLMEKNKSWGMDRLEPTKKFIFELVEMGSKGLHVDKNKLCALLIEGCSYSAINYFQEYNFHRFKTVEEQSKTISDLNQQLFDLKRKHEKDIIALQKQITEAKSIVVEKQEVITKIDYDWDIWVNCPFCSRYQKIKEFNNWSPGEREFESNCECEDCGKIFSVKTD